MAHLVTHHDPFHVHKTLGLLALLNFVLRIYYVVRFGNSFPDFESKTFASACVAIHAALPIVSLALPLPATRNFSSPMIWPEFRLHSILFACRHVVCTIMSILELWPTQIWGSSTFGPVIAECGLKVALVLAAVHIARMISDQYGDNELRTTNAMPYPPDVSEDEQRKIKLEYAKKQFGATLMAVFPGPLAATFNFAPLYAIQLAPFMMTLVRKGKCDVTTYHCVYAAALMYPFYMYFVIIRRGSTQLVDVVICCLCMLSYSLRIHRRWSNNAIWSLVVPIVVVSWVFLPDLEANWVQAPGFPYGAACGHSIWFILIAREILLDTSLYTPFARSILKRRGAC